MHGMKIESGINNCYWNVGGKCTNFKITRNTVPTGFPSDCRDWESKQNCTLTILGVHICGGYKAQHLGD